MNLGVGVRVVKGDQTGYGFTEDLTAEGLRLAAKTAAAIAAGPSRPAPQQFHVSGELPGRYPVRTRWEDVRPEAKLPLLKSVNEKAQAADPRVRKVRVYFVDESSAILLADSDGRILEDLAAHDDDGPHLRRGAGRQARGELLQRRRPRRHLPLLAGADRPHGPRVREEHADPLRSRPRPWPAMPVVLAAGSSGILLHDEAIGHGMGGRLQPQERRSTPTRSASRS
ncbi:MAG: hypothetical protein U0599_14010 [Vicinamibacteria bacterium]